ncbi:DUF305 domain-containing protein [Actinoplanes sp. TBRC 11911]|uniref:DUF305 domain-containing protein n=1 Tax=Actinoplanes sp. TBRC 11911 TaxID=2729386 RepID=UPI00145E389F|nr:DUF305 domain-containing protein [Actinoplanes sp. TBRC 11911]NMO51247.1 DUF305 domain-containing protein [Actinoplanes sp. TBRC 11911]
MNAVRAFAVAAVLALAGCSTTTSPGTSQPPTTSSAPAQTAGFGGTDLAWIEINIAMDEQLLPLLELVPDRSGSAAVQALATQVKAFTDAELSTLRQLRDQAGLPAENPHEGMPMPGMVQADQVAKAAKLVGPEFDAYVVTQIKGYLDQSQSLARSEDQSGVEAQTRSLALQVLRTRTEALSTLKKTQPGSS